MKYFFYRAVAFFLAGTCLVFPAELSSGSAGATRAKWTGSFPAPTLVDDLDLPQTPVTAGYTVARPRLLFSAMDRDELRRKARENPALWQPVLNNARRVLDPAATPSPEDVTHGKTYWRIECVQSAALAWFVTGETRYRDGAIRWLLAHCREPVWGTNFRPNIDLQASWYLYYLSVAYDLLHGEMSRADATVIRAGLAAHAKAIFDDFDPVARTAAIRYDQNHTYTPTVALIAASLALLGEEPAADMWLERARAVLRRCRYVLGEDGYYYEGVGYWIYALHWHVRAAELLGRATGEKLMELPALRDNWRYALHLSLPGKPWAFDVGDTGLWKGDHQRPDIRVTGSSLLWSVARATGSRESRAAADLLGMRLPETDGASSAFLWFDNRHEPRPLAEIAPYHYFQDHGVVAWRSGWGTGDTAMLFRCGPPLGHAAAAKLGQLKDWVPNAGHVHADIGAFYLYAKGAYLAVGTGYTAEKWTRDHNTLLVDGKGQAMDGAYHNEHGVPYEQLDGARIDRVSLTKDYGFASGEFGGAYTRQVKNVNLRRSVLTTARWMLVADDFRAEDGAARRLTWLCHADAPFVAEPTASGFSHIARLPQAGLAVLTLTPVAEGLNAEASDTVVMAGMAPGKGRAEKHGYQLALTQRDPAVAIRFVNLLVPLAQGEAPPVVEGVIAKQEEKTISFGLKWPDGRTERVRVDLGWTPGKSSETGPVEIAPR
ncbi:heparinase II/III domain-containing protein [Rariglobus hedericola]|uniref:DUF4962 domain-containing protein n=1 Tax=Rariglobus hedericola TaxID=2597822 RepID=A0A556QP70_9BACT|nr:heparinase II/III family protein [Rariglobus hedericola]TSJ78435.1 DUF4962 domain-containing protein [Rariglobus hedericola]